MFNVGYISKFTRNKTGTARSLIDTVTFLDKSCFTPICFLPAKSALSYELKKIDTEIVYMKQTTLTLDALMMFLFGIFRWIRLFKNKQIDLIHVQESGYRKDYILAAWLLRIPIVIHLRNPYKNNQKKITIKKDFSPFVAKNIVSNSKNNALPFLQDERFKEKVRIIYNGVDVKKINNAISNKSDILKSYKKSILVGTVGQVCFRKGVQDFIKMIPYVLNYNKDVLFLIVGDDAANDSSYSCKMKMLAQELAIEEHVFFTGHRTDIPEIMKALDIFVLASHSEPFGRVIIEAMAAKTPVVATNVGGIPEIISEINLGVLVEKESPEQLAHAVINFIENSIERQRVEKKSFEHVLANFDVLSMVDKLKGIYMDLLQNKIG